MRRMHLVMVVLTTLVAVATCQGSIDDSTAEWLKKNLADITPTEFNLDPNPVVNNDANVTMCTTESGQDGVCVPYYLCDQDSKTLIEDGYTIIDIRQGNACPNFLQVCCQQSQVVDEKKTSKASLATTTQDQSIQRLPSTTLRPAMSTPSAVFECGYSNPGVNMFRERDGETRNRLYADYGEYPWMVALLKTNLNNYTWGKEQYIGGGSLIHPSVVLTVAHKLTGVKPENIKIRAGEWDSNTIDEEYPYQERDVAKIVVHQNYFRPSLYNDAGLLFLREPVNLSIAPQIGIGCLAQRMPNPDTMCYSMGWGVDDFNNKSIYAAVLKKVVLPLVSIEKCEKLLRATRLGRIFRLHESLTCAGGEAGVDTCRGDGGSSLVCPINKGGTRFAIVGMVAYGLRCGDANVPGVYVNVPNMYGWVAEQMANEGFASSSFTYS